MEETVHASEYTRSRFFSGINKNIAPVNFPNGVLVDGNLMVFSTGMAWGDPKSLWSTVTRITKYIQRNGVKSVCIFADSWNTMVLQRLSASRIGEGRNLIPLSVFIVNPQKDGIGCILSRII